MLRKLELPENLSLEDVVRSYDNGDQIWENYTQEKGRVCCDRGHVQSALSIALHEFLSNGKSGTGVVDVFSAKIESSSDGFYSVKLETDDSGVIGIIVVQANHMGHRVVEKRFRKSGIGTMLLKTLERCIEEKDTKKSLACHVAQIDVLLWLLDNEYKIIDEKQVARRALHPEKNDILTDDLYFLQGGHRKYILMRKELQQSNAIPLENFIRSLREYILPFFSRKERNSLDEMQALNNSDQDCFNW